MANRTIVPLEELEALLSQQEVEGDQSLKTSGCAVLPFENALEQNLNKTMLRMRLKRLAIRGTSMRDCARLAQCDYTAVQRIFKEPEFKKECFAAMAESFEGIDENAAMAVASLEEKLAIQASESFDSLVHLLTDGGLTANQKIKIHQDFLDRAEATAAIRKNINKPSSAAVANADTLARAAVTAREMDQALSKRLKRA